MKRRGVHSGWHVVGGLLVAGWLTTLGLQYTRNGLTGGQPLETLLPAAELTADDAWFGVSIGGQKTGWMHQRLQPHADGFRLEQDTLIQIELKGLRQKLESRLTFTGGADGALQAFELRFSGPVDLTLGGRWQEGRLWVEGVFQGERFSRFLDFPRLPLLEALLPRLLAREELLAGKRFSVESFDPQSLVVRRLVVEVVGAEALKTFQGLRQVYRVRVLGGAGEQLWLDDVGRLWRAESDGGVTLVREDETSARAIEGAASAKYLLPTWDRMLERASEP